MSGEPTPPLDEFLARYRADDNEWWGLSTGDMQNLFDEATDRLRELERQVESITGAPVRWEQDTPASPVPQETQP